ncbi:hypothetical protein AHAS_Ahas15G0213000 [Arachis hypogaea]
MVRGRTLHLNLDKVREIFKLPPQKDDPDSFNRRVLANLRLDHVLKDICLLRTQWINNKKGVLIDRDTCIPVDNPITKESMECTKRPAPDKIQQLVDLPKRKTPETSQEQSIPPIEH